MPMLSKKHAVLVELHIRVPIEVRPVRRQALALKMKATLYSRKKEKKGNER